MQTFPTHLLFAQMTKINSCLYFLKTIVHRRIAFKIIVIFYFSSQAVVGWPPIRSFRMNSLFNLCKADPTHDTPKKGNQKGHSLSKGQEKIRLSGRCLFVKVNMDGDPIGRKVDLNSHGSYESLAISLELMFWGTATASTCKLI